MTDKLNVLVVDDDPKFLHDFKIVGEKYFDVSEALSGELALDMLGSMEPDAVILDIKLGPGMDGLQVLKEIRKKYPDLPVLIVSTIDRADTAVKAIKMGALHYNTKSLKMSEIHAAIRRELGHIYTRKLLQQRTEYCYGKLLGSSPAMKEVYKQIGKVAPQDCNVVIEGENGTGKELVANEIHRRSRRKNAPFLPVDCGTIPLLLFESEMFGAEKGSFTGATGKIIGKFELADGGTLFLDEIGNLTLEAQAKLLRALEDRSYTRLGGRQSRKADIRVLAATNFSLARLVDEKRFRQDLYYRFNVVTIELPPLRRRPEDIPQLVQAFAARHKEPLPSPLFSPGALKEMQKYNWPGNVRELANFVERCVIMGPGGTLHADFVRTMLNAAAFPSSPFQEMEDLPYNDAKEKLIGDFARFYFKIHLKREDGNITLVAQKTGIDRSAVYKILARYHINGGTDDCDEDSNMKKS